MHKRSSLSKRTAVLVTLVLSMSGVAVFLTGTSAASSTAHSALTPVTVYFNPGSADGAGIEYCKESGVCAKHGLAVKFKYSTQGGPQIIPAMTSGQVQFGEPGYEDTIVAASQGIPIIAIAPVSVAATSDATDWTADLSKAGGPVKTLCDLPGRKVAINSLLGLGQLFVDANVYNAHCKGDPSNTGWKRIKFVAILFPQMQTALDKGQVDAIWTLEPFLSGIQHSMKTILLAGSAYRTVPHGPITALDTSVAYLHQHPDVVRKMQLAIMESNGYLAGHPDETRKLLGKYTTVPKSVIATAILPTFVPKVPLSLVQKEANFNVLFGLIKKAPPLNSYNTKVPITVSDYKK